MQSSLCNPFCTLLWQSARSCFYFKPWLIELLFAGVWLCSFTLPEKEPREQTAFLSYCYCLGQIWATWLPQVNHQQWSWGVAKGTGTRWRVWFLLFAGKMRLFWFGRNTRLGKFSSASPVWRGLSLAQEKDWNWIFLLLCLLKTISVKIFHGLFLWEFCIEIGNGNNERGKLHGACRELLMQMF